MVIYFGLTQIQIKAAIGSKYILRRALIGANIEKALAMIENGLI